MSAAPAKTQDPSMEEILASIRRIIADDGDAPKQAAPASSPARALEEDDDVLDLAEMPDVKRTPPGADLEIEAPDLSFQDAPEPPPPAAPDAPEPVRAPPPEAVEPPAGRTLSVPMPAAPKPEPSIAEQLISREATESVNHAFNLLSHTILTQNARTLEDLVRDLLKPMLKVWLDDNLPPLVERLVRTEIERVARGQR